MTKNPFLNALAALGYIIIVATVINVGTKLAGSKPDNSFFAPIALISLFTLSAAVMAYIFLSNPLQMFLDNKKPAAISLFLKTLASFALITLIALILNFSKAFGL